ncbi:MAG TPA: hypothetical protein VM261_00410 [Kofleriaceae bacterium]|nr:hypothetical protein [Kofleriaceae bacterium]
MYAVIIAAVLALTSFSIKPNPKAPSADAVLEHAVDDADFVVHLDVAATLGANYSVLAKLPEDAIIKQVPELREQIAQAVMQAEAGRSMAKGMIGFDPVTDISSMTAFVKVLPGGGKPDILVVVRGTFPADLPGKLASSMGGKAGNVDGRATATMPDGTMMATAKGGALLVGKPDWVTARAADAWKAPARTKGSPWARIATALDAKPFFLVASKPSSALVAQATKDLGDNFGRDLIANHTVGVFAASATGVSWMYEAKDAAFAKRMETASKGLLDLMRAAHLAPRGVAQVAVAALPSYAKMSKELDAVIASKDKLLGAVWDLTGDGKFAAKVKVDGNLVTVVATGKKFSDVVPSSFVVGLGAIGFLTAGRDSPDHDMKPATVKPAPRPVTPRPAGGGGLGTPVKPKTK